MALIFDEFPSLKKAEAFQRTVQKRYPGQPTHIWMDQDEMENLFWRQVSGKPEDADCKYGKPLADMIPCNLQPPIVLVERFDEFADEEKVRALVTRFGGEFAGT